MNVALRIIGAAKHVHYLRVENPQLMTTEMFTVITGGSFYVTYYPNLIRFLYITIENWKYTTTFLPPPPLLFSSQRLFCYELIT